MQFAQVFALVEALVPEVHGASLRFACSQLVHERLDRLLNSGSAQSPRLHQITRGNAFNITMGPNNDISSLATCTSCAFSEDFSNYWTAVLYFRARNGTFKHPEKPPRFQWKRVGPYVSSLSYPTWD